MAGKVFSSDDIDTHSPELAVGSGEVLVYKLLRETNSFECLRAGVGRDGRNTHLRHHLEDTLAECLDDVLGCLIRRHTRDEFITNQLLARFHREVGVDCRGTITQQYSDVVNFTNVTSFNNNADLGAVFRTNEVVVNRRNHHQGWNRRHVGVRVTVRKNDELDALSNCFIYFFTELRQALLHGTRTLVDFVKTLELDTFTSTVLAANVENLGQLVVIDHREIKNHLFGVLGTSSQ